MICDIFNDNKIEYFSAINSSILETSNERLFNALPTTNLYSIFFLMPYYVEETNKCLSKYGSVRDYHIFSKELFSRFEEYFNEAHPNSYFNGFSDHSPFSEVKGASSAGLGIIGQNGLLINQKYSSFVFIGEIITDLSKEELTHEGIPVIEEDKTNYCEMCGACVNSCPIYCPKGSRIGCISNITQKKGDLTCIEKEEIKKSGYIWGCDICQIVCPHTKTAIKNETITTPIPFFHNKVLNGDVVTKIQNMDKGEFLEYPFSWRKKYVIQRNIELVMEKQDEKN